MKKKALKKRICFLEDALLQQVLQSAGSTTTESGMQQNNGMSTLDMKMQESTKISSEKAQSMRKDTERDWLIKQNQKDSKKLEKQVSSLIKDNEKLQKTVFNQEEQIKMLTKDVNKVSKISKGNEKSIKTIETLFTEAARRAGSVPYDASFKKVVKAFLKVISNKGIEEVN